MVFSTQQGIDIAGVRDGTIIMKDGSYRLVLQVTAINFALKSEQEQNSLVFQYQSFLNSLHFPIQIVVRSKRLDLAPYLKKIAEKAKAQTNELIRMQTTDYVDFVGKLINLANIMKKSFYVVIPYAPLTVKKVNIFDTLFHKNSQTFDQIKISDADFKTHSEKLKERAGIAASGLGGMGLHCFQLSTEEIIELFYQIYNPDEAAKERITDAEALSSPVIVSESEIDKSKLDAKAENEKENMIDNTQIVVEQHKQEAQMRKAENDKLAEKDARQPETAQKTPPAPATTPAVPAAPTQIPNPAASLDAVATQGTAIPAATAPTQAPVPPPQPAPKQDDDV